MIINKKLKWLQIKNQNNNKLENNKIKERKNKRKYNNFNVTRRKNNKLISK